MAIRSAELSIYCNKLGKSVTWKIWVTKDGAGPPRLSSSAPNSGRLQHENGTCGTARDWIRGLLPPVIINIVLNEQRPRLKVQQRSGHSHEQP